MPPSATARRLRKAYSGWTSGRSCTANWGDRPLETHHCHTLFRKPWGRTECERTTLPVAVGWASWMDARVEPGRLFALEPMPGSAVLIALADALDVSVDYLVGNQETVLETTDFRKKATASKRDEAQVKAQVLRMLEEYLLVEELLGLPSIEWDKPRDAPYPVVNDIGEADRGARALRDHWGLGIEPIPDLVEVLEGRGVKVLSVALADSIDGLTARVRRTRGNALPVIVVNGSHWVERQRFTIAHELGHMVLSVVGGKVDGEKAAHRFAGAFLMPAEALWSEVGKRRTSVGWRELFDLKQLFGVNVQALTYRCKDLGIFSQALFGRLFDEFKRLGWRDPPHEEPLASREGEKPRRFKRLCLRALAEGVISEPKAAELLRISVRELNRRTNEPPENAMTDTYPDRTSPTRDSAATAGRSGNPPHAPTRKTGRPSTKPFVPFDSILGRVNSLLQAPGALPANIPDLYLVRDLLGKVRLSISNEIEGDDAAWDGLRRLAVESIVSALTPEIDTEHYLEGFREQSWRLFRECLYDELRADVDPVADRFAVDLDDERAPHDPLPIFWNRGLAAGASLRRPEQAAVTLAYAEFLRRFNQLAEPHSS